MRSAMFLSIVTDLSESMREQFQTCRAPVCVAYRDLDAKLLQLCVASRFLVLHGLKFTQS